MSQEDRNNIDVATSPFAFIHQDFIDSYRDTFRTNFLEAYEATLTHAGEKDVPLPFNADEFYESLFCTSLFDIETIAERFELLIKKTPASYEILKHAWLKLIKDFVDYLVGRDSGQLSDIRKLVDRIAGYLDLLYDTYFFLSLKSEAPHPEINEQDERYRRFLNSFNLYLSEDQKEGSKALPIFHTYYRGIAIKQPAEVISASDHSVTLKVRPHMASALAKNKGFAMLESPLHRRTLRGFHGRVNQELKTATFTYLMPQSAPVEKRQFVRVETAGAISVTLIDERGELDGRLSDISIAAVAVYVRTNLSDRYKQGKKITARFTLPIAMERKSVTLQATGEIVRIHHPFNGDQYAYRVAVLMPFDTRQEDDIAKYVNQRQSEILEELQT